MLSTAELKRQLLIESDKSGIKERLKKRPPNPDGITEDEVVDMGNALEAITKMKGWNYIESFILREIDFVGVFFGETASESKIGQGKAMITLMHYVDQAIKAKDEIIAERERKREGKTEGNPRKEK